MAHKKRGTENFGPPGFPDRSRRSEMNFFPNWTMRGLCAAVGCRRLEASNPFEGLPSTQSKLPELKVEPHEPLLLRSTAGD